MWNAFIIYILNNAFQLETDSEIGFGVGDRTLPCNYKLLEIIIGIVIAVVVAVAVIVITGTVIIIIIINNTICISIIPLL